MREGFIFELGSFYSGGTYFGISRVWAPAGWPIELTRPKKFEIEFQIFGFFGHFDVIFGFFEKTIFSRPDVMKKTSEYEQKMTILLSQRFLVTPETPKSVSKHFWMYAGLTNSIV